jgi:predicted MPP superfamily phosphohydrolase
MTRTAHIAVFLGIFALILTLSHFYLFFRISHYLQLNGSQRKLVAGILAALGVITLAGIPVTRMLPREAAAALGWIIYPWMGFLLLLLVVMIATDISWLLLNATTSQRLADPDKRIFLKKAFGFAALGVTGLVGGFSLWNGLRAVAVKPLSITLSRLPKSMDGLRVVQITDLHIGPLIGEEWLRDVVDKVNALKPDLIAITGDLVDGSVEDLAPLVTPIADLKAPLGVFFITGNHEYYSDVEPWCQHVKTLGIRVLRNERVTLTAGTAGETFDLAGVDDWGARQFPGGGPDLPKALAGRDTSKPLLLLAHQPAAIEEAAEHGVDLQLSGHTHGGQIWPFNYLVYLQQPYVVGLHRHKDTNTQIYVSPGTGFWGPPMRFGTAAEITYITLRSAA